MELEVILGVLMILIIFVIMFFSEEIGEDWKE